MVHNQKLMHIMMKIVQFYMTSSMSCQYQLWKITKIRVVVSPHGYDPKLYDFPYDMGAVDLSLPIPISVAMIPIRFGIMHNHGLSSLFARSFSLTHNVIRKKLKNLKELTRPMAYSMFSLLHSFHGFVLFYFWDVQNVLFRHLKWSLGVNMVSCHNLQSRFLWDKLW